MVELKIQENLHMIKTETPEVIQIILAAIQIVQASVSRLIMMNMMIPDMIQISFWKMILNFMKKFMRIFTSRILTPIMNI